MRQTGCLFMTSRVERRRRATCISLLSVALALLLASLWSERLWGRFFPTDPYIASYYHGFRNPAVVAFFGCERKSSLQRVGPVTYDFGPNGSDNGGAADDIVMPESETPSVRRFIHLRRAIQATGSGVLWLAAAIQIASRTTFVGATGRRSLLICLCCAMSSLCLAYSCEALRVTTGAPYPFSSPFLATFLSIFATSSITAIKFGDQLDQGGDPG